MDFEPLLARTPQEAPDPLFPLPGDAPNSFVREDGDGNELTSWEAEALTATMKSKGETREVAHAERIKAAVTLTDTRIVVACTQFRTGGGWRGYGAGGAAVAIAANAVSKAVATRGTKGYSLVGHVRHEWLGAVSATKSAWGSSTGNVLALIYMDPTGVNGICRVNLHLPKKVSTAEAARMLLRRALRHRLRTAPDEKREELESFLASLPSSRTSGGHGEAWTLP